MPTATTRPRSRKLLLLVGVLVLALAGLGAGTWFLTVRLLTPPVVDANALSDIRQTPEEVWSTRLGGTTDVGLILRQFQKIDDSSLLVVTTLGQGMNDLGDNADWYGSYDAEYEAGYQSGLQMLADQAAHRQAPGRIPSPSESAYWPAAYEVPHSEAQPRVNHRGWFDGFAAAKGQSVKAKLVKPQLSTIGSVGVLDLTNGEMRWSAELGDFGLLPSGSLSVTYVASGEVVVAVSPRESLSRRTPELNLFVLSADTGERVSGHVVTGSSLVGQSGWAPGTPPPLLVLTNPSVGSQVTTVARYGARALSEPQWEIQGEGDVYAAPDLGLVWFQDSGTRIYYDLETGVEPPWLDSDASTWNVVPLEDGGLTVSSVERSYYRVIERWDGSGKLLWEEEADWIVVERSGSQWCVLGADGSGPADYMPQYDTLRRWDATTGKPLWKEAYDGAFSEVSFGAGLILLTDDERITSIEPATGEKRATYRGSLVGSGNSVIYTHVNERLTAWDRQGEKLWDMRLREQQSLMSVPGHFLMYDIARMQVTRWS